VGFDGFVDTIIHLVDERLDVRAYRRMETIDQFAQRVAAAAGYSANMEMVPQQIKLGGNGPIMADGLCHMGCAVTYIGALGVPVVHPVFERLADTCERVVSLAPPAETDALEFVDGKLMMGKMQSLEQVNWENLLAHVSEAELLDLLNRQRLVACVNWTMLPFMNGILTGLRGILSRCGTRPYFFVDLADPRKRTREDIQAVLDILPTVQDHARVILGMNEQESAQVEQILLGETDMDIRNRAIRIRSAMDIDMVLIHPLRSACVADENGVYAIEGPFTPTPKLTTGAGDTFNAGFCRGLLSGLSPEEAIGCGVCASGFYVRHARPPTYRELMDFMRDWAAVDCGAI
jgi:hypothetical protein